MNSKSILRRDWFLLQLTNSDRLQATSAEPKELAPIPAPPNHDGMDLSQLPPMSEAMLDNDQLDSLMLDIGRLASDISLMQRGSNQRATADSNDVASTNLSRAGNSLKSGKIQRLQIRYTWKDAPWIDTLEKRPEGYRLVRIRHGG